MAGVGRVRNEGRPAVQPRAADRPLEPERSAAAGHVVARAVRQDGDRHRLARRRPAEQFVATRGRH